MQITLLRLPEVVQLTGLSKRTIYRWIGDGKFPKQTKFGRQISVWSEDEILKWNKDQLKEYQTA